MMTKMIMMISVIYVCLVAMVLLPRIILRKKVWPPTNSLAYLHSLFTLYLFCSFTTLFHIPGHTFQLLPLSFLLFLRFFFFPSSLVMLTRIFDSFFWHSTCIHAYGRAGRNVREHLLLCYVCNVMEYLSFLSHIFI